MHSAPLFEPNPLGRVSGQSSAGNRPKPKIKTIILYLYIFIWRWGYSVRAKMAYNTGSPGVPAPVPSRLLDISGSRPHPGSESRAHKFCLVAVSDPCCASFCCFGTAFGHNWPQDPCNRARLEKWCRTHLQLAPQTTSQAIWWPTPGTQVLGLPWVPGFWDPRGRSDPQNQ